MKKTVLIAAMAFPMMVLAQSDSFTLKGKISKASKDSKAYISYRGADGRGIIDSAELDNGSFTFTNQASSPTTITVILAHNGENIRQAGDRYQVYVDQGVTTISAVDSIKYAKVKGAKISTEYAAYTKSFAKQTAGLEALDKEWAAASNEEKRAPALGEKLRGIAEPLVEQKTAIQKKYIAKNPKSYFSLMALQEFVNSDVDVNEVEPAFNKLSNELRSSAEGQALAKRIDVAKRTQIGAVAPDFSQADPDGKQVKLSDFRGKYVLLDFWASWCGPCRQENPNLVSAYHKFKDKNFTILGVSLDNQGKRADWLKAIEMDKLEWTQLSDLKGWQNEASTLYGVRGIPQSYLIDPDGKIVGANLRGEELHAKLAELLNN